MEKIIRVEVAQQGARVRRSFALAAMLAAAGLVSIQLLGLKGPSAVVVPALVFLGAGSVAGAGLGRGWLGMLGMGLAFSGANTISTLMSGLVYENGVRPAQWVSFGAMYGLIFGLAGTVGFSMAGLSGRRFGFGILGVFGGGVVAGVMMGLLGDWWITGLLPISVPWIAGGVALNWAAGRRAGQ